MGTRSLTVFVDEDNEEIAVLYRQFDGYPDGQGYDLTKFLKDRILVNGYTKTDEEKKNFNGMACLAAWFIGSVKTETGNFYLHKAGTRNCGEEFIYTVSGKTGQEAWIVCYDVYDKKILYQGTASNMYRWIVNNFRGGVE